MLIGRTDDPQNPRRVAAFEVTNPFGGGSRNPSGPAVKVPRQTGRTHDRFSHQIKFFPHTPLHSKGRPHTSTHALRSRGSMLPRIDLISRPVSQELRSRAGRRNTTWWRKQSFDGDGPAAESRRDLAGRDGDGVVD